MLPSDYMCPRCKCQACYALHRKGLDWVISLLGLRPARCLTCDKRFYARYSMANGERKQANTVAPDKTDNGMASHAGRGKRKGPRNIYVRGKSDKDKAA